MTTKTPDAPIPPTTRAAASIPSKDAKDAGPKKAATTTDATQGEPLVTRAFKRKAELEKLLAKTPAGDAAMRGDVERALASIATLMTGDLKHMSSTTSREINTWLESSKHLSDGQPKPRA